MGVHTTPRGFEPLRSKTIHLAGEPLNHSGKVSFPMDAISLGIESLAQSKKKKRDPSMSGNRTPGVCVTGRNVTNYTNTELTSLSLDSPRPLTTTRPTREKQQLPMLSGCVQIIPWSTSPERKAVSYDHTTVSSPHPIRTA